MRDAPVGNPCETFRVKGFTLGAAITRVRSGSGPTWGYEIASATLPVIIKPVAFEVGSWVAGRHCQ